MNDVPKHPAAPDPARELASDSSPIDPRDFRNALGTYATGVTIITAIAPDGKPYGLTCNSFASVSLNPPLVLFVPAKTSRAWPSIQRSGKFCVNFLAADQAELSNQMASRGVDKFSGVSWRPSKVTGSPVIDGTLGHVDCQIHQVHEAGDPYVVVGRVLDLGVHDAEQPLLFFEGGYTSTGT
jgi:3-hydroxy-9,10-secoandrosta-1,3,5(10)-triene-9,17-dione monooxygenase reductase component